MIPRAVHPAGEWPRRPATNSPTAFRRLGRWSPLDQLHDRRTDHRSVSEVAYSVHVIRGGNAKSQGNREPCKFADSLDQRLGIFCQFRLRPGNANSRDSVDEPLRVFRNCLQPVIWRCWGSQKYWGEAVLMHDAKIFARLLDDHVGQQHAVGTRIFRSLCELFHPHADDRIEIAENDNSCCGRAARISLQIASTSAKPRSPCDGSLGSPLDYGTIRQWFAERYAQFDHIGAIVDRCYGHLTCRREIGIAGCKVDYQSLPACCQRRLASALGLLWLRPASFRAQGCPYLYPRARLSSP